jgi:conjugal transfer/entry exclusion protein
LSNEVNTVRNLAQDMSTYQGIMNQLGINTSGGIRGFINSPAFSNVSGYKKQACYQSNNPGACNNLYSQSTNVNIAAQKSSADALLRGVEQTQATIDADMRQLRAMHDALKITGGKGSQQALVNSVSLGNQLALKLNDQIAQMRALQSAQYAMTAMAQEKEAAEQARAKAADDKLNVYDDDPSHYKSEPSTLPH